METNCSSGHQEIINKALSSLYERLEKPMEMLGCGSYAASKFYRMFLGGTGLLLLICLILFWIIRPDRDHRVPYGKIIRVKGRLMMMNETLN